LRWRLRPYSCSMPSPIRTFKTAGKIDEKPRLSQLYSSFLPFPMNFLVLSNFSHAPPQNTLYLYYIFVLIPCLYRYICVLSTARSRRNISSATIWAQKRRSR
jgi:hypothetical protein